MTTKKSRVNQKSSRLLVTATFYSVKKLRRSTRTGGPKKDSLSSLTTKSTTSTTTSASVPCRSSTLMVSPWIPQEKSQSLPFISTLSMIIDFPPKRERQLSGFFNWSTQRSRRRTWSSSIFQSKTSRDSPPLRRIEREDLIDSHQSNSEIDHLICLKSLQKRKRAPKKRNSSVSMLVSNWEISSSRLPRTTTNRTMMIQMKMRSSSQSPSHLRFFSKTRRRVMPTLRTLRSWESLVKVPSVRSTRSCTPRLGKFTPWNVSVKM